MAVQAMVGQLLLRGTRLLPLTGSASELSLLSLINVMSIVTFNTLGTRIHLMSTSPAMSQKGLRCRTVLLQWEQNSN